MTNTTNNALTNDEIADIFNDASGVVSHYRDSVSAFHYDAAQTAQKWLDAIDSGDVMQLELAVTAIALFATFTPEPHDDYVASLTEQLNLIVSQSIANK